MEQIEIKMPKCWQRIVETDKNWILIPTGRVSGKTKNSCSLATILMLENPYYDIVITRASYGSMQDSSYAEFQEALNEMPESINSQFEFYKSPLRIERIDNSGSIYFMGIGGANKDRTKGLKTKHPIKVVIVEETQELKDKESYDQFMASVRRNFGEDVKVIVLGNPPAIKVHWFNIFVNQKELDKDWLVVRMSWLDIVDFLNDYDVKEIIKTRILEPQRYEWLYMGVPTGGFGLVYPMFSARNHVITSSEWELVKAKSNIRVIGCVIGVDGAVNRDCSVCTPLLLLNNGQCVVGSIFYHNPGDNGVIGSHQLVQNYISKWFEQIQLQYHLGSLKELQMNPRTQMFPIFFCVDSAATDLIQEIKFFFSNRASVYPIKKGTIFEMVGVCQSALMNDNIIIIDYGGYYNYIQNKFVPTHTNILQEQLESLIWNDTQTKYEDSIPNDISDSWTYGVNFWYSNQENIQYFNLLKVNNIQNSLISDILKT